MLDLQLREEFRGKRLKGTTVDFTNQSKTGALEVSAAEFLRITYPSFDLLKTVEAIGPNQSRPVVLMGARGQGKSHLLAALYHLCTDSTAGESWLAEWKVRLGGSVGNLDLRKDCMVIAESLHLQRYKFLWDALFDQHPKGSFYLGKWEGAGEKKTDIPSYQLMVDMFTEKPTVLILDEYQTWFEGLTNTKQYPWRNWAFNFIQILSEIAQKHPELLVLVVSVRDGDSDAYQQIHRVNPVLIDFKGPLAKRDRQRLLLYRIFENRVQVHPSKIEAMIQTHVDEYFRLLKVSPTEHEKRKSEFVEAWPYAPHLLKLLDDQVLIATAAQDTRDLIKILVDTFKTTEASQPIITAADFSLMNEKSGVASLLDSVANQLQKDLREKAIRNIEAVSDAVTKPEKEVPHLAEILSALWLRSLSVDKLAGADPNELQIDITKSKAIDDNQFQAELATIVENSFNIHPIGNKLVFKNEENPQAKLLSHAKNEKLFPNGEDVEHLAKEIRAVIGGPENVSQIYRVVVLKKKWQSDPWSEFEEKEQPKSWDDRLTLIVVPEYPDKLNNALGEWLSKRLQERRNTIRFLLPQRGTDRVYYDKDLLVLARAVYLAGIWRKTEPVYGELQRKFQAELTLKLKSRFDRFAVLDEWNFADPSKCVFEERSHGALGDKIPDAVNSIIKQELFIPEDFEEHVLLLAKNSESIGKLLKDLREPRPGGLHAIPWLGDVEIKERVIRMCASGTITINARGMKMLQAFPGEDQDSAWHRMKGEIGSGKHLDETTLHLPDSVVTSSGKIPVSSSVVESTVSNLPGQAGSDGGSIPIYPDESVKVNFPPNISETKDIQNPFDQQTTKSRLPHSAPATSGLNLFGCVVDTWGIGPATVVGNVSLKVTKMTGAQLQQLLKNLPDGVTYGLDLEKEIS